MFGISATLFVDNFNIEQSNIDNICEVRLLHYIYEENLFLQHID